MSDDKARLLRSLSIDPTAKTPPRRSHGVRLAVIAALIAAGLAAAGWVALPALFQQGDKPGDKAAVAPSPETAPKPEPQAPVGLVASGYVVARRKATVAAEITGKVTEVYVEEGMTVAAGQPLARLDDGLAQRDLALARSRVVSADAAIASTSADLADAERILERTRTLSRQDYASKADLTKAQARADLLRGQLQKTRADADTARLDVRRNEELVDKYVIRAPFGGVVVEKSAQPGEMISPLSAGGSFTRTGICTIVDMESLEIEVDVNEAFIGRVHGGQQVDAVLDAYPDWTIPASVIAIVPTANREKATVKVRIAFRQKDPRILPDMAVKVTFMEDRKAAGGTRSSAAGG